jgi:FkbM family methyltransferase
MSTKDEVNWKQTAGELRDRLDRLHRSVLEKGVLRDLLPLRAGTLVGRSALPDSRERERRFAAASSAYAAALENQGTWADHIRRITLDGLTWSVPLVQPDDAMQVERAIGHQDFPYRVITQTREVAIGGIMIDIGANVGRMSIPRVILGDVATAYCAEPDPLNYACLSRNVLDNNLRGLVLPDCVAIGAHTGTVRFERSKTAGGHRVIDAGRVTDRETIEVAMMSLDAWIERFAIDLDQVNFVKVDVQGSEVHVLRGASGVLARRHIAWQMEVDPAWLRSAHSSLGELIDMLQRSFTHFVDLNRSAAGKRVRPIAELRDALGYIAGPREGRTDILVYNLAGRSTA